jgi:hypothetical protein
MNLVLFTLLLYVGWRRPSTWSRKGEGHQRSYKLVYIVELATYLFRYWPTFCKMSSGISQARVHSCTVLLGANDMLSQLKVPV